MSSAVITELDAPVMPLNCPTAAALGVCGAADSPVGAVLGTARREPCSCSILGLARVRLSSGGALTSIGGNAAATCCARAGRGATKITDTRKVETSRDLRCRAAALMREGMVRPRYDVSGTSQRTKSHLGASAPFVKLMSVLADRHLRVCPVLTAGLLARGSIPFVAFPGPRCLVAYDERFTAYSCGFSRGSGETSPHRIPF